MGRGNIGPGRESHGNKRRLNVVTALSLTLTITLAISNNVIRQKQNVRLDRLDLESFEELGAGHVGERGKEIASVELCPRSTCRNNIQSEHDCESILTVRTQLLWTSITVIGGRGNSGEDERRQGFKLHTKNSKIHALIKRLPLREP